MASMTQTIQNAQPLDRIDVTAKRQASETGKTSLFGHALDAVNPLQHVPLVSQGYRAVTGDKISKVPQFLGHVGIGAAVGGPIGAAVGAGVFLIEKGLPTVFKAIGKLFGGGSNPAKEAASLTGRLDAPVEAPPAQAQRTSAVIQPAKGAWPQLSNDQFTAILQAFPGATMAQGNTAAIADKARAIIAEELPMTADVAAQMRANLAKYDAMRMKLDAQQAAKAQ
jgi:hypothetical protein